MPTINEDYVLRQIEMISEMITKALGFKVERRYDEALETLDVAMEELFGTGTDILEMVDAHTAASLIGDPIKIRAYADLLKTKADLLSDMQSRARLKTRYRTLYDEALRLSN